MTFANKHNPSKVTFTNRPNNDLPFTSANQIANTHGLDTVHIVRAMSINSKGRYGEEPLIITDTFILNAPKYVLDTVKNVLTSDDDITLINDGKVGFSLYTYNNKYGVQYGINWVDL